MESETSYEHFPSSGTDDAARGSGNDHLVSCTQSFWRNQTYSEYGGFGDNRHAPSLNSELRDLHNVAYPPTVVKDEWPKQSLGDDSDEKIDDTHGCVSQQEGSYEREVSEVVRS